MLDEASGVPNFDSAPGYDDPVGQATRAWAESPVRVRGRRTRWLVLAGAGALLVGGAFWAGTKATSPSAAGKQYAPAPRTVLTASVVFRRLSEMLPVQGSVTAEAGYQVNFGPVNVPGAQPIVTRQPSGAGAQVANGTLLAQVAGRPVFAMTGATPMYRDLIVGDHGPDVAQLQRDLAALGFPSYDTTGAFGASTLSAVRAFYHREGYSLTQSTSSLLAVTDTRVAPAPPAASSPSRTASASASSPTPSISPTTTASPTPERTPSASASPPAPTKSPSATATASTPPSTPTSSATPTPSASTAKPTSTPEIPQAEVVFIPTLPATIESSALHLGQVVTNPALTLGTAGPQVKIPLTGAQVSLVQRKDTATLTITGTGGTATEVTATVTTVRGTDSGGSAVLRPSRPLAWTHTGDQVTGSIVIASTKTKVLAVPVAALFTQADGQTLVTVRAADGTRTNVPVEVSAVIGGYVPVRPIHGKLAPGDVVLVGQ